MQYCEQYWAVLSNIEQFDKQYWRTISSNTASNFGGLYCKQYWTILTNKCTILNNMSQFLFTNIGPIIIGQDIGQYHDWSQFWAIPKQLYLSIVHGQVAQYCTYISIYVNIARYCTRYCTGLVCRCGARPRQLRISSCLTAASCPARAGGSGCDELIQVESV